MLKGRKYKKTLLENGITIISEENRSFYSATIGVWVKCGSRDETPSDNGTAHFIEHMLFKGTSKRSALDIAREVDAMGGEINAFTSTEATCYYLKVLESHLERAVDILSDMFLNSLLDEAEIEREREVILQEIRMVEDTPDDLIFDIFSEAFWGDSPLALPVLGSAASVFSITRESLSACMKRMYSAGNIIITAAGNVDHEKLVERFQTSFSTVMSGGSAESGRVPAFSSSTKVLRKRLEQVHFCLGTKGLSCSSPKRYASYILNTILGSGMSSRLFQEIREKRGLAYSIYSYLSSYEEAGLLGIYGGTSADSFYKVIDLVVKELLSLRNNPISHDDLCSAKEQLKGNIILGLENSESVMQRLANNEIYFGRDITVEESIKNIEAVTAEDVQGLASELFCADSLNVAVLGDLKKGDVVKKMDEVKAFLMESTVS